MNRHFALVDVFTDRAFTGNQLAVFTDARGLATEQMQTLAREMNFSESTFVLPPVGDDSSYRIRMFSPRREVPFAGHPSVGTAHAVLEAGLATPKDGLLVQDGIAGKLPLRVDGEGRSRTIAVRTPLTTTTSRPLPIAISLTY